MKISKIKKRLRKGKSIADDTGEIIAQVVYEKSNKFNAFVRFEGSTKLVFISTNSIVKA